MRVFFTAIFVLSCFALTTLVLIQGGKDTGFAGAFGGSGSQTILGTGRRGFLAKLTVVFGIGRACHIAFWEPHFAAEFDSLTDWKSQTHRIAAQLHPMTIEQNAITSFKSRTTLVPAYANTIGPGLFLQSGSGAL